MSKIVDVWDLAESTLRNSKTWLKYADACGMCTSCKEHSGVLEYCCTGMTYLEGGQESASDLWEQIEWELDEYYKAKQYDSEESEATGN